MTLDEMIDIFHVYFDGIPYDDLTDKQINWINSHKSALDREYNKFDKYAGKACEDPTLQEYFAEGNGFATTDQYWDYVEKVAKKYAR